MRQLVIVTGAAVLVLAGCGAAEKTDSVVAGPPPPTAAPSATTEAEEPVETTCEQAVHKTYRLCLRVKYGESSRATIERSTGSGWEVVARHPPGALVANMANGRWSRLWLSPDGRMLLAQWSGECEAPTAFFLPANGGRLRVVTGEHDWKQGAESTALGWLDDGGAKVRLGDGGCGNAAQQPGVYAIDPDTFAAEVISSP